MKSVLNKKKRVFRDGDQEEVRRVQVELKLCLREAKEAYRKKLKGKLMQNNVREVWDGMKTITGCKNRIGGCVSSTRTSSMGAPQGPVLSPILFTLYTADFHHNSALCHVQNLGRV